MRYAMFTGAKDNRPKNRECASFDDFDATVIGKKHRKQIAKDGECFSPVQYPEFATRSSRRVLTVEAVALDFDKLLRTEMNAVRSAFPGIRHVYYTTYSHPSRHREDGTYSARIVAPLSEPIPSELWASAWQVIVNDLPKIMRNGELVPPCDVACKDSARVYYVPTALDPDDPLNVIGSGEGVPIDTSMVLKAAESLPRKDWGPRVVLPEGEAESRLGFFAKQLRHLCGEVIGIGDDDGRPLIKFESCPWAANHTAAKPDGFYCGVDSSGWLYAKCWRTHCQGKRIHDLLALLGAGARMEIDRVRAPSHLSTARAKGAKNG